MTTFKCWMNHKKKKIVSFKLFLHLVLENVKLNLDSRLDLKWMRSGSRSNCACSKLPQ